MADQHTFADSDEEYAAAVDAAAERQFVLDDEERSWDMMLVAVIEDVPHEAVAKFLDANCKSLGYAYLWLIDTYDNLPTYTGKRVWGHTEVASDWRSLFVGKSLDEVADFVKSVDIAAKAVCRNYFAVLKKSDPNRSQRDCEVLICKTPNEAVGRTEVQYSEYQADAISGFHVAFDEDNWEVMMDEQGW